AEKPLLTAGAYRHIAAACHADHAVFYRGTKGLPHVEFTYGDAAKQVGDEGSPIFKCMGANLQHYRYDFFSFKADPPVAE
nr:hypothetical protein [Tanacetum cinerariifolium]